jgi:hypothetical protein
MKETAVACWLLRIASNRTTGPQKTIRKMTMTDFLKPHTGTTCCPYRLRPSNAMPRFALGRTAVTTSAAALLAKHGVPVASLLERFHAEDWGDAGAHGCAENELALSAGGHLLAIYRLLADTVLSAMTSDEQRRTPAVFVSTRGSGQPITICTRNDC